mmetsp:Transcript_55676/g.92231  ORF Transcript_55676/g.92231 Transcript_55676/m.92231 type:complete len:931 (-) Transcript_55676:93-2885(-)
MTPGIAAASAVPASTSAPCSLHTAEYEELAVSLCAHAARARALAEELACRSAEDDWRPLLGPLASFESSLLDMHHEVLDAIGELASRHVGPPLSKSPQRVSPSPGGREVHSPSPSCGSHAGSSCASDAQNGSRESEAGLKSQASASGFTATSPQSDIMCERFARESPTSGNLVGRQHLLQFVHGMLRRKRDAILREVGSPCAGASSQSTPSHSRETSAIVSFNVSADAAAGGADQKDDEAATKLRELDEDIARVELELAMRSTVTPQKRRSEAVSAALAGSGSAQDVTPSQGSTTMPLSATPPRATPLTASRAGRPSGASQPSDISPEVCTAMPAMPTAPPSPPLRATPPTRAATPSGFLWGLNSELGANDSCESTATVFHTPARGPASVLTETTPPVEQPSCEKSSPLEVDRTSRGARLHFESPPPRPSPAAAAAAAAADAADAVLIGSARAGSASLRTSSGAMRSSAQRRGEGSNRASDRPRWPEWCWGGGSERLSPSGQPRSPAAAFEAGGDSPIGQSLSPATSLDSPRPHACREALCEWEVPEPPPHQQTPAGTPREAAASVSPPGAAGRAPLSSAPASWAFRGSPTSSGSSRKGKENISENIRPSSATGSQRVPQNALAGGPPPAKPPPKAPPAPLAEQRTGEASSPVRVRQAAATDSAAPSSPAASPPPVVHLRAASTPGRRVPASYGASGLFRETPSPRPGMPHRSSPSSAPALQPRSLFASPSPPRYTGMHAADAFDWASPIRPCDGASTMLTPARAGEEDLLRQDAAPGSPRGSGGALPRQVWMNSPGPVRVPAGSPGPVRVSSSPALLLSGSPARVSGSPARLTGSLSRFAASPVRVSTAGRQQYARSPSAPSMSASSVSSGGGGAMHSATADAVGRVLAHQHSGDTPRNLTDWRKSLQMARRQDERASSAKAKAKMPWR